MSKKEKTFEKIHENEIKALAAMEAIKESTIALGIHANATEAKDTSSKTTDYSHLPPFLQKEIKEAGETFSQFNVLMKKFADALYTSHLQAEQIIKDDFLQQYRELAERQGEKGKESD